MVSPFLCNSVFILSRIGYDLVLLVKAIVVSWMKSTCHVRPRPIAFHSGLKALKKCYLFRRRCLLKINSPNSSTRYTYFQGGLVPERKRKVKVAEEEG